MRLYILPYILIIAGSLVLVLSTTAAPATAMPKTAAQKTTEAAASAKRVLPGVGLQLIGPRARRAVNSLSPHQQALLFEATSGVATSNEATSGVATNGVATSDPATNGVATDDTSTNNKAPRPAFRLKSISYESPYTYGEQGSLFLRHGLKASGYQFAR